MGKRFDNFKRLFLGVAMLGATIAPAFGENAQNLPGEPYGQLKTDYRLTLSFEEYNKILKTGTDTRKLLLNKRANGESILNADGSVTINGTLEELKIFALAANSKLTVLNADGSLALGGADEEKKPSVRQVMNEPGNQPEVTLTAPMKTNEISPL